MSDWTNTSSSPPGPNLIPDKSFRRTSKPRVNAIAFGDGYSQRLSDGLNAIGESWSLEFSNRSIVDINIARAFLESKNGVQAFTWDPPGQVAATSKTLTGTSNSSGKILVTSAAHGFINGTKVIITGANGSVPVAGTWIIEQCTVNTFVLSGSAFSGSGTTTGTITVPTTKVICNDWNVSTLFTDATLISGYGTLSCTFERVYE